MGLNYMHLIRHRFELLDRSISNQFTRIFPTLAAHGGEVLEPFGLRAWFYGLLRERVGKNDEDKLKLTVCI